MEFPISVRIITGMLQMGELSHYIGLCVLEVYSDLVGLEKSIRHAESRGMTCDL